MVFQVLAKLVYLEDQGLRQEVLDFLVFLREAQLMSFRELALV